MIKLTYLYGTKEEVYVNPQHITCITSLDNGSSRVTLIKKDYLEVVENPEEIAKMCNRWYKGTYVLPSEKFLRECQTLTLKAREGDRDAAEELLKKLSNPE